MATPNVIIQIKKSKPQICHKQSKTNKYAYNIIQMYSANNQLFNHKQST